MHAFYPFFGDVFFLVQLLIICVGALIVSILERRFYQRLLPQLQGTDHIWDDALLIAAHLPLRAFIWLMSATFIIGRFQAYSPETAEEWIQSARALIVIGTTGWFFWRLVCQLETNIVMNRPDKQPVALASTHTLSRIVRAVIVVIAVLGCMQTVGLHVDGLLAFGGIGTLVVGLAAQNILANLFGGLMLYIDRPFHVGDWIRAADGSIEGYVQEIGWRITHIKTLQKRPLYIPNSVFTTMAVENPSRMTHRRIQQLIGVYVKDEHKLPVLLTDIRAMLDNHPGIDHSGMCIANLISVVSGTLSILIDCLTFRVDTVDFRADQEDILVRTLAIFQKHGVALAEVQKLQMPVNVLEKITIN